MKDEPFKDFPKKNSLPEDSKEKCGVTSKPLLYEPLYIRLSEQENYPNSLYSQNTHTSLDKKLKNHHATLSSYKASKWKEAAILYSNETTKKNQYIHPEKLKSSFMINQLEVYAETTAHFGSFHYLSSLNEDKKEPVGESGEGDIRAMFNQSEINVLLWCANGKTSYEIGKILSLSEHTINHYINICVKKLSASNRIHAVAKAIKLKIIDVKDIS